MNQVIQNAAPALARTTYEQDQCEIGIVHLGYGAFHRAHQAVYIDDYMEATGDLRWGIAAVNLRETEQADFSNAQKAQQGYLLKTTTPAGESSLRLVRAHCRFEDWSSDRKNAEALLALPTVHTITITVTESGYTLHSDGTLNIDDPVIQAELNGKTEASVYAYLTNGLKHRLQSHGAPVNILCCDNIRANGAMLKRNFLAYLHHRGEGELKAWVEENASFPCSMVDRITPRATPSLIAEMDTLFPGQDFAPIHGEDFTQWVIEKNFKAPMPGLDRVGVEIVEDVDPYEEAKIRILNGGHTGLCYLGALAGHQTFDQAFNDPKLRAQFDAFELEDVLPGLDGVTLPFDKHAYLAEIAARFSNAAIADQLQRICMDGYSKMPIYIRPTIEARLRRGATPTASFNCVASWVVYARRWANGTLAVPYNEPYWDQLETLLVVGAEQQFATHPQLWGDLPHHYSNFVPELIQAINQMEQQWPA